MSKHTPGPWKTDDEFIYDDSGRSIAYVLKTYIETYHSGKLPYQANARLIAAAPELLEALKKSTDLLECLLAQLNVPYYDKFLKEANELIAKIEGDE